MEQSDRVKIYCEIRAYCDKEANYSYYDMKEYALRNKPEWVDFLKNRNNARFIAETLKSAKRSRGIKYKDSFCDAYDRYMDTLMEIENNE
ncbi:MAG: hypothetical protein LUC90_11370 [Lachnospiraceae bacterium]|nr:hypothetical protein [Lachnospiraceae bacterium]